MIELLLSDDCLLHVFNQLNVFDRIRTERVSKRFQQLARRSWRSIHKLKFASLFENDHEFFDVQDCNKILTAILRRAGPHLRSLDLSDNNNRTGIVLDVSEKSLKTLSRFCSNLHHLDLSYKPLSKDQLSLLSAELASSHHQLESISLVRCLDDEDDADDCLRALFRRLPQLKAVDLSMNDTLTGACFDALPPLAKLCLNNCSSVTLENLARLAERCPHLVHLELRHSTHDLGSVFSHLSSLQVLDLNSYEGPPGGGSNCLSTTLYECPSVFALRSLDIGHSNQANDQLLKTLAQIAPNLERLAVAGKSPISDTGLRYIGAKCTHLRELDISWCESLSDTGLASISHNARLEVLHAHMCDLLTDNGLTRLVLECPTLRKLDVTGCSHVTRRFLFDASTLATRRQRRLCVVTEHGALIQRRTLERCCNHFFTIKCSTEPTD